MKVTNPHTDRGIMACITPQHNPGEVPEGKWYEIPAGESIDVEDFVVASTLIEYGAKADPADLQAARELWSERNRALNSRTASASASEGAILGRQQATVDVRTGTVDGGVLKGAALETAVATANEAGAGIDPKAKADERRSALAAWQVSRGSSSPVEQTKADEFVTNEDGSLKLDEGGQPIPVASSFDVDAANPPHEVLTNDPAPTISASPEDVDAVDTGEALIDSPEPMTEAELEAARDRAAHVEAALAALTGEEVVALQESGLDADEIRSLLELTEDEREILRSQD